MQLIANVLFAVHRHLRETLPGNPAHKNDMVNLKDIAALTGLGKRYAKHLIGIDKQAKASAESP